MSLHFSDIQIKISGVNLKWIPENIFINLRVDWVVGLFLFCDHHERQFVCLLLTDQRFGGSKCEMYLNMLFRNLVIPWVDKVYPDKSRLSRVKSCAFSHIIILILLMKTVVFWGFFGFFLEGGQDSGVSSKTLFLFSHNNWRLSALFFLCGGSPSSLQRSHSKKRVLFPLPGRVSSVHKCLLTPPHRYQSLTVHFQEVKDAGPDFPSALYGNSVGTYQTITAKPKMEHVQTTIVKWTWYLKKDVKTFIDTRHTHERNTFQNVNMKRTQQSNKASGKYSHSVHLDCISSSKTGTFFSKLNH